MSSENYFEMTEPVQLLSHIQNNLEFSFCKLTEGIEQTAEDGFTIGMIRELQENSANHISYAIASIEKLIEAYGGR